MNKKHAVNGLVGEECFTIEKLAAAELLTKHKVDFCSPEFDEWREDSDLVAIAIKCHGESAWEHVGETAKTNFGFALDVLRKSGNGFVFRLFPVELRLNMELAAEAMLLNGNKAFAAAATAARVGLHNVYGLSERSTEEEVGKALLLLRSLRQKGELNKAIVPRQSVATGAPSMKI